MLEFLQMLLEMALQALLAFVFAIFGFSSTPPKPVPADKKEDKSSIVTLISYQQDIPIRIYKTPTKASYQSVLSSCVSQNYETPVIDTPFVIDPIYQPISS